MATRILPGVQQPLAIALFTRTVRPLRPARGSVQDPAARPADPAAMQTLIEVLCGVDRPESTLTWKRNTPHTAIQEVRRR